MKTRIIRRVLSGALALSLVLASSITVSATASGTVAGATAASGAVAVVANPDLKETSSVGGVQSTVGGVFILTKGIGVATRTDAAAVAAAYNIPNGGRAFVKAYDMDAKRSVLAKASLDGAAAAYGATPFGYVNFELGQMVKGEYSLLSGGAGVEAAFSIPGKNYVAGASYALIIVQEGGVITIVADSNPSDNIITGVVPAGRCAIALVRVG